MDINLSKPFRYLITIIEDSQIPFIYFLISFLAVLVVRYIGEGYSQPYNYLNVPFPKAYWWSFLHTVVSYIACGLGLVTILNLAANIVLVQAVRFVLFGFIVIWMTPLLDLMFGPLFGTSTANTYVDPLLAPNLFYSYLTFFGGFAGMSLGLHLEIITILLGFFVYFRVKHKTILFSLFLTWLCYSWIFFMGCAPFVLRKFLAFAGLTFTFSNTHMIKYFCLESLLIAWFLCWLNGYYQKELISGSIKKLLLLGGFLLLGEFIATIVVGVDFSKDLYASIALSLFFVMTALMLVAMKDFFAGAMLGVAVILIALTNTPLLYFFVLYALLSHIEENTKFKFYALNVVKCILLVMMGYELVLSAID